jgi:uncharacterized membrane protein
MTPNARTRVEFARLAAAYVSMVIASSSMEGIWYLGIASDLYEKEIGSLMNVQFDVLVAAIFYLVYALGAIVFSVRPALESRSLATALQRGAMLGFFCFSAHDLTDLADIHGYTWKIALIDISWGIFMTATACSIAYFAGSRALRAR